MLSVLIVWGREDPDCPVVLIPPLPPLAVLEERPVPVSPPVITHKDWLQGLLCPHSRAVSNLIGCFS